MINFIPIFPLKVVIYPGERLNLHIFEPRYKQLIGECIGEGKPFGIPTVLDSTIEEYGTLVEVVALEKKYDSGEMDVRTQGKAVFRILEVVKDVPEKLYDGAIVDYPANQLRRTDGKTSELIVSEIRRLYRLVAAEDKTPANLDDLNSYGIAHLVGLSLPQEYELLRLLDETQRLEYIRRHLTAILPVVQSLEAMKTRIQLNGHFKDLSLGDLKL